MNKITNNYAQDAKNKEKLVTIMVTELENSSDADCTENDVVRHNKEHHEIVDLAVRLNNGVFVMSIDNDMLFLFHNAQNAIPAAVEIQKDFDRLNMSNKSKRPVLMRISLHSGKLLDSDGEIPTGLINFARHIKSLTLPGETFASQEAYHAVYNTLDTNFRLVNTISTTSTKKPKNIYKVLWNAQEVEHGESKNTQSEPNERTIARFKLKRLLIIIIPLLLVLLLTLREEIMSQLNSESKSRVIYQSIEN